MASSSEKDDCPRSFACRVEQLMFSSLASSLFLMPSSAMRAATLRYIIVRLLMLQPPLIRTYVPVNDENKYSRFMLDCQ